MQFSSSVSSRSLFMPIPKWRKDMRSATFLIKPASSLCDMRCRYCFYHDISDIREVKSMGLMSETTAQALIQAAFAAVEPGGFVQFAFQGGNPPWLVWISSGNLWNWKHNSVQRMWALDTPFRPMDSISMKSGRPF